MKTHHIKLLEDFADDILEGRKSFEIRKNDRTYQNGDHIIFHVITNQGIFKEHRLNSKKYEITYILSGWGLKNGYVVFGIKEAI